MKRDHEDREPSMKVGSLRADGPPPGDRSPAESTRFLTTVGKHGATLEHFTPLDALEQALRRGVLELAEIFPPRYVITIAGDDGRLTRGGLQAKRARWKTIDGEDVETVSVPRAFFLDREKVVLSIVVGGVHLALDSGDGYMSRKVVERLARVGVKTRGTVNRYGGGKKAEPYIAEEGPLRAWLDSAPAELFAYFTVVVDQVQAKVRRKKKEGSPATNESVVQLRRDLDASITERNDAVARFQEVSGELDATMNVLNDIRPRLSSLQVLLAEREDQLAAKEHEIAEKNREIALLQQKLREILGTSASVTKRKRASAKADVAPLVVRGDEVPNLTATVPGI